MHSLPREIAKLSADVVVIGGGGAASRAALSARRAGARVRLVTKAPFKAGGSTVHGASEIMSMGAAGFGDKSDSAEVHFEDTMRVGRGFVDPALVRVLAEEASARIHDLIMLGVPFDEQKEGYKLIKSDFGSYARTLGVRGKTGRAFVEAISDEIVRLGVDVDENVALIDLVRDADGAIAGVIGYDTARRVLIHYEAPCVVLGTGGIHSAFEQQVSTAEMTGDGQAICFRHGAELVNLEFHQLGAALVLDRAVDSAGADARGLVMNQRATRSVPPGLARQCARPHRAGLDGATFSSISPPSLTISSEIASTNARPGLAAHAQRPRP